MIQHSITSSLQLAKMCLPVNQLAFDLLLPLPALLATSNPQLRRTVSKRLNHFIPTDDTTPLTRNSSNRNSSNRNSSNRNSSNRNKDSDKGKKCFVCGKSGCWSTNHTKDEKDRRIRQYISDFEGNNSDDNQEASNFYFDIEPYSSYHSDPEAEAFWAELAREGAT